MYTRRKQVSYNQWMIATRSSVTLMEVFKRPTEKRKKFIMEWDSIWTLGNTKQVLELWVLNLSLFSFFQML